jgi:hypothetical protein
MRKFLIGSVLLAAFSLNVGCFLPIYDANPDVRARQLIFSSENMRHIPETWERAWFLDVPDFMTPYRTHGGII